MNHKKYRPLIRAEQARLFNDPNSEYEILVASDAIGMGLNLSIKRIIFNSLFKNNGEKIVRVSHAMKAFLVIISFFCDFNVSFSLTIP